MRLRVTIPSLAQENCWHGYSCIAGPRRLRLRRADLCIRLIERHWRHDLGSLPGGPLAVDSVLAAASLVRQLRAVLAFGIAGGGLRQAHESVVYRVRCSSRTTERRPCLGTVPRPPLSACKHGCWMSPSDPQSHIGRSYTLCSARRGLSLRFCWIIAGPSTSGATPGLQLAGLRPHPAATVAFCRLRCAPPSRGRATGAHSRRRQARHRFVMGCRRPGRGG